jgi:hypothetical protein
MIFGKLRSPKVNRPRVTITRQTLLTLGASGIALLLGLFLFGVWTFAHYELNRLREPLLPKELVPRLRADDLARYVRRVRPSPVPAPPSPVSAPSPSPGVGTRRAPASSSVRVAP